MPKTSNTPPAPVTSQDSPCPEFYPYVLSYLGLRKSIGIIGIALPFVLIVGKILLESPGILPSISAYYYSVMRGVFVGSLCAAAVFLISYRFDRLSDIASDIAGIAAIGVALFPTTPAAGATQEQVMIGYAHSVFAGVFFVTLAVIALFLFQSLDPGKTLTARKRIRNTLYRTCGSIMFVCIVLALTDLFLQNFSWLQALSPGFWLETLAILAFGVAWFVKGETILKDP